MPNRTLTVAGIQTWYGHDLRDNIARTEALVREAAKEGAQVVLPSELFQGIYFCTRQDPKWLRLLEFLEKAKATVGGRVVDHWSDLF